MRHQIINTIYTWVEYSRSFCYRCQQVLLLYNEVHMKNEYALIDSHKLAYHPEWVRRWHAAQGDWELAKTIRPLYIEISPVGQCNHRCPWCAVDYIGYKLRLLPTEVLITCFKGMAERRKEGEDWNGVKSVMFAGEGEPTLHPSLAAIMLAAKSEDIDVALTTNGTGMVPKFTNQALQTITWVKVSLDAATAQTHAINHHATQEDFAIVAADPSRAKEVARPYLQKYAGEFDRILGNIEYAARQNRKLGLNCMIGAQLLMNPTNIHEVLTFVRLMKQIGCDYCVIKPYSQHHYSIGRQETLFGSFTYQLALVLKNEVEAFNDERFNVVFRSRTMENYEDPDRHYTVCQSTPMAWGYVMATGEFVSCSAYLPKDVGVGDQRFVLGNIKTQSFQQIWEGQRRRENWEFVNNDLDIHECRKNCRMDAVNRFLWDIKGSSPWQLEERVSNPVTLMRNVNFI